MIVKLKTTDGYALLINSDHVVHVSQAMTKATNGSAPNQPVIGKCVLGTIGGEKWVLDGTVEEIWGQLKRGERVEPSTIRPAVS